MNGISATEYLSEKSTLSLRDTDIVQLVSAVCEASGDLAEMLGIRLRFVCAMERCICAADAAALEQALYQLLSNALKYTPKNGTVTVELKRSGKQLLLSVADTGCGIPSEQMGHLFDRASVPPRCRTGHGLGLGLLLCRSIAKSTAAGLLAESVPGKGSRFTLSLPERISGNRVSDVPTAYNSGFNRTLLGLADALPGGRLYGSQSGLSLIGKRRDRFLFHP